MEICGILGCEDSLRVVNKTGSKEIFDGKLLVLLKLM
jgi:hypothetical protein